MADPLGTGLAPPAPAGGGFDTQSLLRQLRTNADQSAAYNTRAEQAFTQSQDREAGARENQQLAVSGKRDELKAKLQEGGPEAPETQGQPTPPNPGMDPEKMKETLSLITALAAFGGALTRQPLTASLNNFSAAVQGYVQGDQQGYQNQMKEFNANLQKSKAENDTIWKKYEAARAKYGSDIQGLQDQMKLIAAETQNPIDIEMARRGDIVSLMKMHETTNSNYNKVMEQTAAMLARQDAARQASEDKRFIASEAGKDRRSIAAAAEAGRNDRAGDREERLSGRDARNAEDTLRKEHDKLVKPITEYERDINKVRTAMLTNSPLGDVEARQLLTSLSKGARGTNMQMKLTQNFGDLGTRLGGMVTNFASGRMTDGQKREFTGFLDALEQTVVNPEKQAIRQRFSDVATRRGLNVDNLGLYGGGSSGEPAGGGAGGAFDPNAFLDSLSKPKR